jgi:hypothetical protein
MELALEKITELLLRSPEGKQLQAQLSAKNTRQSLFAMRESLREQQVNELPPLALTVEQARLELVAAQTVVQQKLDIYEQAYAAHG